MDNEVKIDPLCLYDVWLDMALIFNYLFWLPKNSSILIGITEKKKKGNCNCLLENLGITG